MEYTPDDIANNMDDDDFVPTKNAFYPYPWDLDQAIADQLGQWHDSYQDHPDHNLRDEQDLHAALEWLSNPKARIAELQEALETHLVPLGAEIMGLKFIGDTPDPDHMWVITFMVDDKPGWIALSSDWKYNDQDGYGLEDLIVAIQGQS